MCEHIWCSVLTHLMHLLVRRMEGVGLLAVNCSNSRRQWGKTSPHVPSSRHSSQRWHQFPKVFRGDPVLGDVFETLPEMVNISSALREWACFEGDHGEKISCYNCGWGQFDWLLQSDRGVWVFLLQFQRHSAQDGPQLHQVMFHGTFSDADGNLRMQIICNLVGPDRIPWTTC